jgi:hypothetical protein
MKVAFPKKLRRTEIKRSFAVIECIIVSTRLKKVKIQIYKITTVHVILHVTLCFPLREEHRVMVFENRILM